MEDDLYTEQVYSASALRIEQRRIYFEDFTKSKGASLANQHYLLRTNSKVQIESA